MDSFKNNLAKEQLIEDLKESFSNFIAKGDYKQLNVIWQNLHHAKQEGWFDNEFYTYWLVKCINTPDAQGAYILCVPSITEDICGFNPRNLGHFLTPRIDFMISINEFPKVINIINYALQGSAIFEKAWLMNTLEHLEIEDRSSILKINAENEVIHLNKSL